MCLWHAAQPHCLNPRLMLLALAWGLWWKVGLQCLNEFGIIIHSKRPMDPHRIVAPPRFHNFPQAINLEADSMRDVARSQIYYMEPQLRYNTEFDIWRWSLGQGHEDLGVSPREFIPSSPSSAALARKLPAHGFLPQRVPFPHPPLTFLAARLAIKSLERASFRDARAWP